VSQVNQQVTLSSTSTTQAETPGAAELTSGSTSLSLGNSPSLTDDDDDDDDDDGATTSVSEDANDLVCDLSLPGRSNSTPDVEDHPSSVQQGRPEPAECPAAVVAGDRGGSWVNSRRRKSARPQWHYEGTVLDKSQRTTVNGSEDDLLAAWEVVDHRGRDGEDPSTASDDRSQPNALSNCVTSE